MCLHYNTTLNAAAHSPAFYRDSASYRSQRDMTCVRFHLIGQGLAHTEPIDFLLGKGGGAAVDWLQGWREAGPNSFSDGVKTVGRRTGGGRMGIEMVHAGWESAVSRTAEA